MKNVKKAAAVKYDYGATAPKVTAVGMGHIADKILEKAEENEVPVVENEELANLLTNVDVGDEIPLELYDVVAKVIAYVMDIDNRMKSR
ncbi:EscU/YscU/HrcU family type III secretion system export apparatus switch protein [Clostridium sp. UBA6640]|jgi:flagellar biosynthesis protein|uniref:EscU/YscU/HrcU family type III secretion system export apparatus switch protein n=1 Tax=Clostridium sp. UBA6640 TaxID=1946370 RepID=UPI0025B7B711|nr:EscU/YscU/HrcU family type III secretion system export apparatus switch protein [Clostridium sp. UBA6640]